MRRWRPGPAPTPMLSRSTRPGRQEAQVGRRGVHRSVALDRDRRHQLEPSQADRPPGSAPVSADLRRVVPARRPETPQTLRRRLRGHGEASRSRSAGGRRGHLGRGRRCERPASSVSGPARPRVARAYPGRAEAARHRRVQTRGHRMQRHMRRRRCRQGW